MTTHVPRSSSHAHSGEWGRFLICAPTFVEAARVAAERNFWLHCWEWVQSPDTRVIDKLAGSGTETVNVTVD